jgi:hypothetical protein
MTSITLASDITSKNAGTEEEAQQITSGSCPTEKYPYVFQWPPSNQTAKTSRALSCNEERIQSPALASSNNNRFQHLCARLKRRFSISKDYRARSEDMNRGLSVRFSNYQSFPSTVDDTFHEFEWPDFEKIYDSIPPCLARTLPGLDDISVENDNDDDDHDHDDTDHRTSFLTDEINEQTDLFERCKRGKHFRRNAICHKLDKTQYNGQLDTFIQQLMVEKLMRTWT